MASRPESSRLTRRALVGGAVAGAAVARAVPGGAATTRADDPARAVPFHGAHQAGIATARQHHLAAAAFTVTARDRSGLRDLLRAWSAVAARLTAGRPAHAGRPPGQAPADSGEALGLPPARLTVTFGFGASLFDARYGLAARKPGGLGRVPALRGDALDPARSDGDIFVQCCADDRQVAFHALRALIHEGRGHATVRWRQSGFRAQTRGNETPRNLMGFKDGTVNIAPGDRAALDRHVWVGPRDGAPAWLRGGTFLLMRRIRIELEAWDAIPLRRQELAVGRHKASGAPLGARRERDPLGLGRLGADGQRVIPLGAHVRHASPDENGSARILRRGFSYDDGVAADGTLDAGLFFLAFDRAPARQSLRMLDQLATYDRLNEFTRPVASGLYAVPPGARVGGYVGAGLLR